jgi:HlyD family secretion protein
MTCRAAIAGLRIVLSRRLPRPQWNSAAAWVRSGAAVALLASTLPLRGAEVTTLPAAMAVTVAKVQNACFADTLVVMGNVVPRNEILVRPEREGLQIKEILVEAGSTVDASAVLARLIAPNESQSVIPVTAPIAGVVLAAPTVVGAIVSARGEPLFRIAAEGDLDLAAEVPAKKASRLAIGQSAMVKAAGMDEAPGRVRLVSTLVDSTTQLGQMRISLEHNPLLRVGAFARATINFGQSCGASIPLSALLFGPDGAVVQSVRNDRVETRRVTAGLTGQSSVEIREGIAEGDIIVVRAGAFLREGDRIRPVLERE